MAQDETAASKKKRLIDELYSIDEDTYVDVVCKTLPDLSKPKIAKIKNFIANRRLMLGDTVDQGTDLTRSPRVTLCAWQVDLIFRGDLIPKNGLVFMDVEKINLKESHKMVAATVAIVDARRKLILWCIIKHENACQYFPNLTGLDAKKIKEGISFPEAKCFIRKVLAGNIVVGAAIRGDLESIGYDCVSNNTSTMDTQDFFRDSVGPFSLYDLARHFYPKKNNYQCSKHAAIADARMTVKVAKRMIFLKRENPANVTYNQVQRSPKRGKLDVGDRCVCNITAKKYTKVPSSKSDWRKFDLNAVLPSAT